MLHVSRQPEPLGLEGSAFIGVACACLQLLAPDHVCTLMSLGASVPSASPWPMLRLGGAWGLAHCMGTVIVCVVLTLLRDRGLVDTETWEHYGDYLIGFSLVLCGIYFAVRESQFVVEDVSGTLTVRGCSCHPVSARSDSSERASRSLSPRRAGEGKGKGRRGAGVRLVCDTFAVAKHARSCEELSSTLSAFPSSADFVPSGDPESDPRGEFTPLLLSALEEVKISDSQEIASSMWIGSGLLGLIQGLCCPMALVSVNLLAYTTTKSSVAIFVLTYVMATVAGAALLAFTWSHLIQGALGKFVSPRVVYRGSCACTIVFGILWIAANHFDALDALEFDHQLVLPAGHKAATKPALLVEAW